MAIYALRKRRGHWMVFSGNDDVLAFDNYHEAVETTRAALNILELAGRQCFVPDEMDAEVDGRRRQSPG
jgi:hypothetical protein